MFGPYGINENCNLSLTDDTLYISESERIKNEIKDGKHSVFALLPLDIIKGPDLDFSIIPMEKIFSHANKKAGVALDVMRTRSEINYVDKFVLFWNALVSEFKESNHDVNTKVSKFYGLEDSRHTDNTAKCIIEELGRVVS